MSIPLNVQSIIQLFNKKKLDYQLDAPTQQVQVTLKIDDKEIPIFFNIISEGHVFQSIAYIPVEIPSQQISEVARLLHMLNSQLDIPGFGMDEKHGLIFFRVAIPCLDKTFREEFIDVMIGTTRLASDSFLTGIEKIANGSIEKNKS